MTAKIAFKLGMSEEEQFWQHGADEIKSFIIATFWNEDAKHFCCNSSEGNSPTQLTHSSLILTCPVFPVVPADGLITPDVLLLPEVGFLSFDDPRFVQTLR